MGDCRIRVVIAKSLFASLPEDLNKCFDCTSSARVSSDQKSVSFVRMYSADTTIREIVDGNFLLKRLYFGDSSTACHKRSEFSLWDCTLNPPRDITSWPIQDYPDLQGSKSMTLHAAGLFPSGTWMVIPKGMAPNAFSGYDNNADVDVQYNNNRNSGGLDQTLNSPLRVEFNDPALKPDGSKISVPLPSQVMEAVSNRFAAEDEEEQMQRMHTSDTRRNVNAQRRAQKEVERAAKLDQRIALIEQQSNNKSNKKKNVSDQVLRMLVKSRATGDKNLKERDRLYCQCLILLDDTNETISTDTQSSKEYRYFSPQDTFAKIANSFSKSRPKEHQEWFSEVLCRKMIENTSDASRAEPLYGRFPMTMRLYEAQSNNYLSLSEKISNYFEEMLIIRWYKDREDATPLIQDLTIIDTDISETKEEVSPMVVDETKVNETESNDTNNSTLFEDHELTTIIQTMDEANNTAPKKKMSAKKSAAALKVRQMKMKSKAKGNKKLKMDDRVFLEVVSILETGKKPICEAYFFSKNDPIDKILKCVVAGTNSMDWELLLPLTDSRYRPIEKTSILLKEADEQEVLKSYDRIILRPKHNQK